MTRFEMIVHIDKHFNPSGTGDTLSHIFDLIDMKANFSRVIVRLKMRGVAINLAL